MVERLEEMDGSEMVIRCVDCKHLRDKLIPRTDGVNGYRMTCDAFPDGIPTEIMDSAVGHAEVGHVKPYPYPCAHGIQFELNVVPPGEEVKAKKL